MSLLVQFACLHDVDAFYGDTLPLLVDSKGDRAESTFTELSDHLVVLYRPLLL